MIESLSPIKAFISVDLPAFGFPIIFTNPDLNDIQLICAKITNEEKKNLFKNRYQYINDKSKGKKKAWINQAFVVAGTGLEPMTFGL